jgi:hypothetical protein
MEIYDVLDYLMTPSCLPQIPKIRIWGRDRGGQFYTENDLRREKKLHFRIAAYYFSPKPKEVKYVLSKKISKIHAE